MPKLLILQGSSFCNINCAYCYVRGRDLRARMSDAVLDAVAANILHDSLVPDDLAVAWHAGEALALPVAWLDAACARLERGARPGQRLRHGVQTNAMLIDNDWIELIRRREITVGVSLDGPRDLHDAFRRTRAGGGTFDAAMAGVDRLREAGIPFDTIAVLTRPALDRPDELFDFFSALGPRLLGFNVEEIEGPHTNSTLDGSDADLSFRRFLDRFLDRYQAAGAPFRLRDLERLANAARGRSGNDQAEPLAILTVSVDGGLSTFSPELIGTPDPAYADFVFGNVLDGGPGMLMANPALRRVAREIEGGRRRCRRTCGYEVVCGGGAPANKYFETGALDADETLFCRLSVKATLDAMLAHEERRLFGAEVAHG